MFLISRSVRSPIFYLLIRKYPIVDENFHNWTFIHFSKKLSLIQKLYIQKFSCHQNVVLSKTNDLAISIPFYKVFYIYLWSLQYFRVSINLRFKEIISLFQFDSSSMQNDAKHHSCNLTEAAVLRCLFWRTPPVAASNLNHSKYGG